MAVINYLKFDVSAWSKLDLLQLKSLICQYIYSQINVESEPAHVGGKYTFNAFEQHQSYLALSSLRLHSEQMWHYEHLLDQVATYANQEVTQKK